MHLRINGALRYLWRAVDQHSVVLDILVQARRNATAAKRLSKRLLAGLECRPNLHALELIAGNIRAFVADHTDTRAGLNMRLGLGAERDQPSHRLGLQV